MPFFIDTSILLRLANRADRSYPVADRAITELHRQKETIHVTSQNLIEFRNVGTRPIAVNGLGLSIAAVEALAAHFENLFSFLPESPAIFPAWKALVTSGKVIGKRVHDARLVAICQVNQIANVLTFNIGHFTSLVKLTPGISVVDPATL